MVYSLDIEADLRLQRLQRLICEQQAHHGEFVCKGELLSQPGQTWGCGSRFANETQLLTHFESKEGQLCMQSAYDEEWKQYNFSLDSGPVATEKVSTLFDDISMGRSQAIYSRSGDSGYHSANDNSKISYLEKSRRELQDWTWLTSHHSQTHQATERRSRSRSLVPDAATTNQSLQEPSLEYHTDDIVSPEPTTIQTSRVCSLSDNAVMGSNKSMVSPALSASLQEYSGGSETSEGEISFVGFQSTWEGFLYHLEGPKEETRVFVHDLARKIVQRCLSPYDCALGSGGTPTSGSSSGAYTSNSKDTSNTSLSTSNKRARPDRDDKDGGTDGDDLAQHPGGNRGDSEDGIPTKLFACPFAKFDPDRYSERNHVEKNYRNCASKYLCTIPRLKQHLYRTHKRPAWYCGNCYISFKTRELSNQHNRERPPCETRDAQYEERMTDQQFEDIKRRTRGKSEYETWYTIYQILFPGVKAPRSPYVSTCDPATVQHFVTFFRWYGAEEFLGLLRDRRERDDESIRFDASTQAIVDEAFEIALPNYLGLLGQGRQLQLLPAPEAFLPPARDRPQGSQGLPQGSIDGQTNPVQTMVDLQLPVHPVGLGGTQQPPWTTWHARELPNTDPLPFEEYQSSESAFTFPDGGLDPSEIDRAFDAYDMYSVQGQTSDADDVAMDPGSPSFAPW